MKIVHSDGAFVVYGNEIQTYDKLPPGTYKVCYEQNRGPFLVLREDPVNTEPVYGDVARRVQKTLKTFSALRRNMGVILSGRKGSGKTLTAKVLMERARAAGVPTILVENNIPGLPAYIASIEQTCVVLFDEFEKAFPHSNNATDAQSALLSLFDGLYGGRKLFVITCNDPGKLSPFLLNRPGRFHYHFASTDISVQDIRAYLRQNLAMDKHHLIEQVVRMAYLCDMTYDMLRAIAFDLNLGYGLQETWQDLNMQAKRAIELSCRCEFTNGVATLDTPIMLKPCQIADGREGFHLDLDMARVPGRLVSHLSHVNVSFDINDIRVDADNGLTIDPMKVKIQFAYNHQDRNIADAVETWLRGFSLRAFVIEKRGKKQRGELMQMALQTGAKPTEGMPF